MGLEPRKARGPEVVWWSPEYRGKLKPQVCTRPPGKSRGRGEKVLSRRGWKTGKEVEETESQ